MGGGLSRFVQNGKNYEVLIGNYPCYISIDNVDYYVKESEETIREIFLKLELKKLSKKELVEFIINILKNGEDRET